MSFQNENLDETFSDLNPGTFCPFCGSKSLQTDSFCVSCGADLIKKTEKQQKSNPPSEENINYDHFDQHQNYKKIRYAELGDRFLAVVIDGLIISALGSVIGLGFRFNWGIETVATSGVIGFLYYFLLEINNGQTFGKMALKIKTVDAQTLGKITPRQGAIHVVGKAFFLPLDVILGLITKKNINPQRVINLGLLRMCQEP